MPRELIRHEQLLQSLTAFADALSPACARLSIPG
jgi:hypothetical protein